MEMETEDQAAIDALPEEMLLKILEFLPKCDLLNAALACKKWNRVISNNASTMKNLPLCYNQTNSEDALAYTLDLTRKFHKIELNGIDLDEHFLKVLERHASEVRHLICRRLTAVVNPTYSAAFSHILRLFHKLQKISLDEISFDLHSDELSVQNQVHLTELRKVVLNECHPNILKFFDTSKVTSLKQKNFTWPLFSVELPCLEELALHRQSATNQLIGIIPKATLKRFSIYDGDEVVLSSLMDFKDTLEELEIAQFAPLIVYETIFKNMTKLQLLKIHMDRMPWNEDFTTLKPNLNIKKLIVQAKEAYYPKLLNIIGNLPNIETLVLNCDLVEDFGNSLMSFIALNLLKLRVLEIRSLDASVFVNVSLPSLRELTIYEMSFENAFEHIAASCPDAEKITLKLVEISVVLPIPKLEAASQHLKKLQHFYIGEGFVADKATFVLLWNNFPALKDVTIMQSAIDDDPTMINDFIHKSAPRLTIMSKAVPSIRGGFDLWAKEDIQFTSYDAESNSDEDSEFSLDLDIDDEDGEIDYWDGDSNDEDFSDSEFPGTYRPG